MLHGQIQRQVHSVLRDAQQACCTSHMYICVRYMVEKRRFRANASTV